MDLTAKLARFNLDPALTEFLINTFQQAQDSARQIEQLTEQTQRDAQRIQENEKQIEADAQRIKAADIKIASLTYELAHYKRVRFANKSEAFSPGHRELFEADWNTDTSAIEAEAEIAIAQRTGQAHKPKPTGRQPLPDHLPRVEHRHEPSSCNCDQCGADLVKIREEITEQLDVEPARFFVRRHIRPQYACRHCETIQAQAVPAAVIDGSVGTPGLHAWVVTQKYLDHLPLYRIEQISERYGAAIGRSTLAEWVGRVGVALQPLVDRLTELLKQRAVLHADETPIQQLDPGRGKTQRAYLWVYRTNALETAAPIVVFDYQPSRAGSHAQAFLQGWQGHLMVDDYSGYKALFHRGITELACLAHARRKFFELHAVNPSPLAQAALEQIGQLYAIERAAQALDVAARAQHRQQQAQPLLDAWHTWLLATRAKVAPGSGIAKAIDYSLRRWAALARYATRGDLPIDNNPVENALRPIALGRKNWLFAGSERAGKRAAAIQSLLATAKLNGLDPYAWLKQTLEKLPTWPNHRIDELLPLRSIPSPL